MFVITSLDPDPTKKGPVSTGSGFAVNDKEFSSFCHLRQANFCLNNWTLLEKLTDKAIAELDICDEMLTMSLFLTKLYVT